MVEDRKSEILDEENAGPAPDEAAVDVSAPPSEPRQQKEASADGDTSPAPSSEEPAGASQDAGSDGNADGAASAESLANDEEQESVARPLSDDQTPVQEDDAPDDEELDDEELDDEELDDEELEDDGPPAEPLELVEESEEEAQSEAKQWYILKVQVNREKSICDALIRRVKVAGLDDYFGEILIPTEDVREFTKTGKQRIIKRKLYPGYILVNMAINDDTWFLVRETPGIGDFTGAAGKPTPMESFEVERILKTMKPDEEEASPEKTNIRFKHGDRVRVKEGYFQNFEGEVETIDEANGRITVMINIFGRPTPVELDHWQFEDV